MPSASTTTPSRPSTPVLLAVLALVFVLGVGWILHGQRQTKAGHAALEELEAHAAQLARLDALLQAEHYDGEGARLELAIPPAQLPALQQLLADLSRGRVQLQLDDVDN